MFQGEPSAILLTFIKLLFVIKIFVLSSFEWPFYTGFTVVPDQTAPKESKMSNLIRDYSYDFFNKLFIDN